MDDLKKEDLSGVEAAQKNANKSTEELLRDANGYLATISNSFKAGTAKVPTAMAASKFAQDKVLKTFLLQSQFVTSLFSKTARWS